MSIKYICILRQKLFVKDLFIIYIDISKYIYLTTQLINIINGIIIN